ncbi:PKD domain-containing protein [Paenibacillus tyrfis]|uniref:PKD domain-containing protein n=1 Tax=Paenibacillus tyrfis TaxID=1501230 RepID=UPI0020A11AD6|nr:PKD domain-containing protein [Paenibacillus tyrfis]MCP1312076.1 PKD domain-containing protein [Paenibacillus tyrfis]
MDADTRWSAKTYKFEGRIEVFYKKPTFPDLIPIDLVSNGPVKIGEPTTFTYTFRNVGEPIKNKSFSILFQDRSNGKTIYKESFTNAAQNVDITGTFQYTAMKPGKLLIGFFVDSDNTIDEGPDGGEDNNYKPFDFPVDVGIDGDFRIIPGQTIKIRDNFELEPINFKIPPGCTYTGHSYRFIYQGQYWKTNRVNGQTVHSQFPYPNGRPFYFGEGVNNIAIKIETSCGETDWIKEKPLTVLPDPNNRPPYFKAGWFYNQDRYGIFPPEYFLVDDIVNVRVIHDNNSDPKSPSDPDNDPIRWKWDFDSNTDPWVQKIGKQLHEEWGKTLDAEGYYRIKADKAGMFNVKVTADDGRGGTRTETVTLNVLEPNPIAVCTAPKEIKENRPVPPGAIHADKSWSPARKSIDHSKDLWVNKLDKYYNGTLQDVTATVTLAKVVDYSGLESTSSSSCDIIVHPDLPPVGKIVVPPLGIRNQTVTIRNQSYSPDGDQIVSVKWRFKYDAANNGFQDDPWLDVLGTDGRVVSFDNNTLVFKADMVGKYLFDVQVTEDYGKSAMASDTQPEAPRTLDIVNNAPHVFFAIEGQNDQPGMNPPIMFNASTIVSSWALFDTNTNNRINNYVYRWAAEGSAVLRAGLGREMERQESIIKRDNPPQGPTNVFGTFLWPDLGFGANFVSSYKGTVYQWVNGRSTLTSTPILVPSTIWDPDARTYVPGYAPAKFNSLVRTNKTYLYFDEGSKLYAFNKKKLPQYSRKWNNAANNLFHLWDRDPYDFILAPDKYTVAVPFRDSPNGPTYTKEVYLESEYQGSVKYEVAGGIIYKVSNIKMYDYFTTCRNDDGSRSWTCGVGKANNSFMIEAYDAYTGKLLSSNKDNPLKSGWEVLGMSVDEKDYVGRKTFSLMTKGESLVIVYQKNSSNGASAIGFVEINPQLQEVRRGGQSFPDSTIKYQRKYYNTMLGRPVPEQYVEDYQCKYSDLNGLWKGPDGEFYTYIKRSCDRADGYIKIDRRYNEDAPIGVYLLRINNDLSMGWTARLAGMDWFYPSNTSLGGEMLYNNFTALVVNPYNRTLLTRSYTNMDLMNGRGDHHSFGQYVNMDTGAVSDGPVPYNYPYTVGITPGGGFNDGGGGCSWGTDGKCSRFNVHEGELLNEASNEQERGDNYLGGFYVGDGLFLGMYNTVKRQMGNGYYFTETDKYMYLESGPLDQDPVLRKGFVLGQFVSPDSYRDTDITFRMKMTSPNEDTSLSGFSFRMLDPTNRYSLETDGSTLYLSRYVGGSRTVLRSQAWPFDNTDNLFKISLSGDNIQVFMNGVPVFEVQDATFAEGKMGPFTDKSFVTFTAISIKQNQDSRDWMSDYAIWENGSASANVRYKNILFEDPENDPMAGNFRWGVTHTPKFLNNQGLSTLNGKTFDAPQQTFDAVGVYMLTLRAQDDPNRNYLWASMVFDQYRKWSNTFQKKLIVHRRPVAQFTLAENGDGTVAWNDTSYDPDRFDPNRAVGDPARCSAPDVTGYDYCSMRGIVSREYGYVDPDGMFVAEKLTRPKKAGTYTVYLQVIDEYGAKSYPATATITLRGGVPEIGKPTVQLTHPTGSKDAPTIVYTTKPTITWNQDDNSGLNFTGYEVQVLDKFGSLVVGSGLKDQYAPPHSSASWQLPMDIERGELYQVKVRAENAYRSSDWSNIGWMRLNSPPTVTLTFPNGPNESSPNIIGTTTPTMSWIQNDIDGQNLKAFRLQVIQRYEDGKENVVYDVTRNQDNPPGPRDFTVDSHLPHGVLLYAKVMVSDGDLWSNWSNIGWFRINFAPVAELTFPTGTYDNPSIGGVKPLITWNQTDPDPDTTFTKYHLIIAKEDGTELVNTGPMMRNTKEGTGSFQVVDPLPAGIKVQVKVKVWDEYTDSAWSQTRWMFTNRPPVAAFTWKINPPTDIFEGPAWEGDHIQLINQSTDPDGDPLTYDWQIHEPGNTVRTDTAENPLIRFAKPGDYDVTLTATDPYGASHSVTRRIVVSPIVLVGYVNHTDEWNKNRIQYNLSKTKTENAPRTYDVFFPGEKFLLKADTIGNVVNVDVNIMDMIFTTRLTKDSGGQFDGVWTGSLWDESMMRWKNGTVIFRFTATSSTGYQKSVDVPIIIDDDEYWRQHRSR